MENYQIDQKVKAEVVSIRSYGAILAINNDDRGLLHISEISSYFVTDINEYISEGELVEVQIIDIDEKTGFLKFSLKNLHDKPRKVKNRYKHEKIDENEVDFNPLKEMLPLWIAKAKEQKND